MSDNNGWTGKPGVPMNPEQSDWHWLQGQFSLDKPAPYLWQAFMGVGRWSDERLNDPVILAEMKYIRPAFHYNLTPAEVDARVKEAEAKIAAGCLISNAAEVADLVAAAHKEWLAELNHDTDALMEAARQSALEEAARVAEGKVYKERYRTWPWWLNRDGSEGNRSNDSDIVEHADKIAAAIRALSDAPSGTYASEAEQERDEFFNRLGRVTEELRLPMDATASRIIEIIRERVDNEREACASVSVKVEVPEGAETWTPLEAWEEALIVFDEAFRDAIRSRALKGETND
jgi:hypothetical protein